MAPPSHPSPQGPSGPRRKPRSKTMPSYTPPLRDLQFVLHEVLKVTDDYKAMPRHMETHEVTTPPGFKDAYAKFVEGGWGAVSCDPEFGGQGLPFTVNQCLYEM